MIFLSKLKSVLSNKLALKAIKTSVSLLLIIYIFLSIDIKKVLAILGQANPMYLSLSLILVILSIYISSIKWKIILNKLGYKESVFYLFVLYIRGTFFNSFLPSNIGGDGYKILSLGKEINSKKDSFVSVFLDRLSGFIILFAFAFISLILLMVLFYSELNEFAFSIFSINNLFILLLFSTTSFLILLFVRKWFYDKYISIKKLVADSIKYVDLKMLTISIIFNLITILNNYLVSVALNLQINPLYYLIFIPIILLLISLPITMNGIGVREFSFIFLFGLIGIDREYCVLLSLIPYFILLLIGLSGGVSLFFKFKSSPSD